MVKQVKARELTTLDVEYVDAKDVILVLQRLIDENAPNMVYIYKTQYEYSNTEYVAVMVDDLETDKEEAEREASEASQRSLREAQMRKQYEDLKKQFG